MNLTSLWLIVLIGLLVLFLYSLVIAFGTVKRMADRLMETNKQLMVMISHRDGGSDAARALLAASKPPQRDLQGISGKKAKQKPLNSKEEKNAQFSIDVKVP